MEGGDINRRKCNEEKREESIKKEKRKMNKNKRIKDEEKLQQWEPKK